LTGIVLATEITGRGDLTLGMLAAALGAMLVAMLMKSPPIYQSLREHMLVEERRHSDVVAVVLGSAGPRGPSALKLGRPSLAP
jgi:H+/Cl- antiporter ClcA